MGQIVLSGLEFYAYHGYYDEEQQQGNRFEVDIEINVDLGVPAQSDRLEDTIDYGIVYETVKEEMEVPSRLLEHIAQRIVSALKVKFPQVDSFKVCVTKYNPPLGGICKFSKVCLSQ